MTRFMEAPLSTQEHEQTRHNPAEEVEGFPWGDIPAQRSVGRKAAELEAFSTLNGPIAERWHKEGQAEEFPALENNPLIFIYPGH